jgi:hypothetical protein
VPPPQGEQPRPPIPQAESVGVTQSPPWQQPLGQVVALQGIAAHEPASQ